MEDMDIRQARNEVAVFLGEVNEDLKQPENNAGTFFEFTKEIGHYVTPHGRKFTVRVIVESEDE